jgi:hypothetical protein
MGEVSFDDYYSLCGRLDTLEHVHEVLVAVAAQMLGKRGPDDEDGADVSEDEVVAVSGAEDVVAPDPVEREPDDADDDAGVAGEGVDDEDEDEAEAGAEGDDADEPDDADDDADDDEPDPGPRLN